MSFRFENLDARTRKLMLDELEHDVQLDRWHKSKRLSPIGEIAFVPALRDAIRSGNERTLAHAILVGGMLDSRELSHRKGRMFWKDVPRDAHLTLAEGEFNRYYLRGLCLRALEDGQEQLEIYRAKDVYSPRAMSEMRLGTFVDAGKFLRDLRTHVGVETALRLPAPNSGLSARLPRTRAA